MDNLLFFVMGMVLTYLLMQRPLQITVHHKHEDITPKVTSADIQELEQEMLKPDDQVDAQYEQFNETLSEVNNIMSGSDR